MLEAQAGCPKQVLNRQAFIERPEDKFCETGIAAVWGGVVLPGGGCVRVKKFNFTDDIFREQLRAILAQLQDDIFTGLLDGEIIIQEDNLSIRCRNDEIGGTFYISRFCLGIERNLYN